MLIYLLLGWCETVVDPLLKKPSMSGIANLRRIGLSLRRLGAGQLRSSVITRTTWSCGGIPFLSSSAVLNSFHKLGGVGAQQNVRWFSTPSTSSPSSSSKNENESSSSSSSSSSSTSGDGSAKGGVLDGLEQRMMTYFHMRSEYTLRMSILLISALIGTLYVFRQDVKEFFGEQTADVAAHTLDQHNIRVKGQQFVKDVLTDEDVQVKAMELLNYIITSQHTQDKLRELVYHIIQESSTQDAANELSRRSVKSILDHPDTLNQFSVLISDAMKQPQTVAAATVLAQEVTTNVLNNPSTYDMCKSVMRSSAYAVMKDPEMIEAGKAYVNSVLTDPTVRETGGDAAWAAFKSAFVPSFWRSSSSSPPSTVTDEDSSDSHPDKRVKMPTTEGPSQHPSPIGISGEAGWPDVEPTATDNEGSPDTSTPSSPPPSPPPSTSSHPTPTSRSTAKRSGTRVVRMESPEGLPIYVRVDHHVVVDETPTPPASVETNAEPIVEANTVPEQQEEVVNESIWSEELQSWAEGDVPHPSELNFTVETHFHVDEGETGQHGATHPHTHNHPVLHTSVRLADDHHSQDLIVTNDVTIDIGEADSEHTK